jgi:hypothetical protein
VDIVELKDCDKMSEEIISSSNIMELSDCPVCQQQLPTSKIESHVDECFENQVKIKSLPSTSKSTKRRQNENSSKTFGIFNLAKKAKVDTKVTKTIEIDDSQSQEEELIVVKSTPKSIVDPPLADAIRPVSFDEYVGQNQVIGENTIFRNLLKGNNITSMIFWGPPGE